MRSGFPILLGQDESSISSKHLPILNSFPLNSRSSPKEGIIVMLLNTFSKQIKPSQVRSVKLVKSS